jgi:hypothetical protein
MIDNSGPILVGRFLGPKIQDSVTRRAPVVDCMSVRPRYVLAGKPTQLVPSSSHPAMRGVYQLNMPPFPCTFRISHISITSHARTEGLESIHRTEPYVFSTTLSSLNVLSSSIQDSTAPITIWPSLHMAFQKKIRPSSPFCNIRPTRAASLSQRSCRPSFKRSQLSGLA